MLFFNRAKKLKEAKNVKTIIFGAPGSGKGTYASRLQTKLGVDIIAMGGIFREIIEEDTLLGEKVRKYVKNGLLVPDDIAVEVLKKRIAKTSKETGFILDGYPRTIEQAKALEKITKIDAVILLEVPDWLIIERLSKRRICKNCGEVYNIRYLKPKKDMVCDKCGGPLYQRSDDISEVVKKRLEVYREQTKPILQYYKEKAMPMAKFYCNKLDITPEMAVEKILQNLKKLGLA